MISIFFLLVAKRLGKKTKQKKLSRVVMMIAVCGGRFQISVNGIKTFENHLRRV